MQGACVVHRGQDAHQLQVGVEPLLDLADRLHQQRDPAQREELALQRHDHPVRGGEGVDREQAQRRLAVDEHQVVVRQHRGQRAGEHLLACHLPDQLHLRGGEVDVGRDEIHPRNVGGTYDVADRGVALHQHVVDRVVELVGVDAQPDRQRALRVEVDQQHPAAALGQRGAEVDCRRRLADPALLVAHRDGLRAPGLALGPALGRRLGEVGKGPAGGSERPGIRRCGVGLGCLLDAHRRTVSPAAAGCTHPRARGCAAA